MPNLTNHQNSIVIFTFGTMGHRPDINDILLGKKRDQWNDRLRFEKNLENDQAEMISNADRCSRRRGMQPQGL